jgi:adenosylmethionine-8-amino-7-oxononanoate aminotransferase
MHTFRKFFYKERKEVTKAQDQYIYFKTIGKVLDATSGWTGYASMGHNNKEIVSAINSQLKKFSHIDYNEFIDTNVDLLSKELVMKRDKLDRVWFSGNSGSESLEAAMKLSFQDHLASGKKKFKFIHRSQSFHGATLHPLLISDIDIFKKFSILGNKNFLKVSQHNPYAVCYAKKNYCKCGKKPVDCLGKFPKESDLNYLYRSLDEVENLIKKNNPDTISAFIGETQLGSLVGDVPALKKYWEGISKICKKNDIHLIMDEVYCGLGRTGKLYAYEWENIKPDFVCLGKNMTSGVVPLSAILTKSKIEKNIIRKLGRVSLGHTFQAHSLAVAACLKLIKLIKKNKIIDRVNKNGEYMMHTIKSELKNNEYFSNIRGRGFSFAVEHATKDNNLFARNMHEAMLYKYKILINSKFHRTSFLPIYTTPKKDLDRILDKFINTFKFFSKRK